MVNRSRIGDFALEQPIDANESTYLAIHVEEQKKVAIQFVAAPLVGQQEKLREAYMKEFYQLKQLRHAHIVKCFGGGVTDDEAYFVWELVRGESLAEILQRRDRMDWISLVDYGIQMAEAMQHAHEGNYFHGGLTPSKVLIHHRKGAKILGFRVHTETSLTESSRPYVAPELLSRKTRPTAKSDIYSLGAIFYELLTGNSPAPDAPPVATIVMDCPVWLDGLIQRMLAERPQDRPHTAAAVAFALQETCENVGQGTSVAEHTLGGLSPIKISNDKQEARRVLGKKEKKERRLDLPPFWEESWFLTLLLVVLIGGVAAWLLVPPSEQTLYQRAEALMATDDTVNWTRARDSYIQPLLDRFPDSEHAEQAQEWLDLIAMRKAESRIRLKVRLGRARTEPERLYFDALTTEQDGDRISAIQKYEAIIDLLPDDEASRPYVNLAKRQLQELTASQPTLEERKNWLEKKLAEADRLRDDEKMDEAKRIWTSIVSLYEGNSELRPFVEQAQQGLNQAKE